VGVLLFVFTVLSQGKVQAAGPCPEWNLAAEFRVSPDQANPNPDNCGNANVWHFMKSSTLDRDPMTYSLLPNFVSDSFQIPGIQEWQAPVEDALPAVGINATGTFQQVYTISWPAGVVRVHPMPTQLVIVGWKSPITGTVMVTGGVDSLDNVWGSGVSWFIDHFDGVTNTTLASGSILSGGSQVFQDGIGGNSLANANVKEGDFLYFIVDPGENYYSDSTGLTVMIKPTSNNNPVCPETEWISTSSYYDNGEYEQVGQFAYDCNLGPEFWAAGTYTGWITAKFTAPIAFNCVVLTANALPATNETYTLYGSNDGETWTQFTQATRYVTHSAGAPAPPWYDTLEPITFPQVTYQYLRIEVDGGASWVALNEVQLCVDSIAPSLEPAANRSILWPPNHKMVDITIAANASDNNGGPVTLAASVSGNEPEDGLGDGDTAPDWTTPVIDQANGTIYLQLRAERSGSGNGRIYTIAITATDTSGNFSQANVQIIVPHDKSKK
jgi:hypothetical protein